MAEEQSDDKLPWISIADLPYLIFFLPFGLLLGFHLSLFGYGIYRITRIPYLVTIVFLFVACWIPSIFLAHNPYNPWYVIATVALFVAVIGTHLLFCSKDDLRTGCNIEYTALPHIILINIYLLLPVFK